MGMLMRMNPEDTHRPDVRGLPMVNPPDPARLEAERAWLADVATRPWLARQVAYVSRGGPGYLQSALTLGGGSASASILAGAAFGYDLLWVAPLGMILGGIVFMAIAHQTLSTGMRPFEAMRTHAGPVFAYGWAFGTVLASVVWHFAQYALASAVLVDLAAVAFPEVEVSRWLMGLLVLAWAIPTALSFGSRSNVQRIFERIIRTMVWIIVALFAVVAFRVGFGDPATVAAGFVPGALPLDRMTEGGPVSALPLVIAGLATAVGVNMTFLYPYTLLARGWGREHRELAKADVAYGMVIPFVIVVSLLTITAAATLYDGFTGSKISPVEAAGTLGGLLGSFWGRVIFDLGLLAMLLTTITLHMVCSGLACGEMFKLRVGSAGYRIATLLPAPGVLGAVYWSEMSIWVAVPTSIVAGLMLPLAYVGFIRLQTSRAYLGADRPEGAKAIAWIAGMVVATLVIAVFIGREVVTRAPGYLDSLGGLLSGGAS